MKKIYPLFLVCMLMKAVTGLGQLTDLSITKTDFVTTYTPGSNGHTYIVEATNNGPTAVTGAVISDNFPAQVTSATWTVTYPGGGSGPASGSGNISALVNLPVGAKARFIVTVHIALSATGNMVNTAAVEAPPGITDTNPSNNSATDIDAPKTADMSVTKTDGTTTYTPGGTTTYTVVYTNNGPDALAELTVIDNLPPQITSASWTLNFTGGPGPFITSGTGNINMMIDFPVGSTATFTIVANISPTATGNLVNTAFVASNGYIDPNPADNSATDIDVLPCTNSTQFPPNATAINPTGALVTITTCSFAGEYSAVSGAVAGQTLQFTSSVPGDVITIHSGSPSGPIIAAGVTPLTFANTFTGILYAHWNTPGCGTQTTCRTTTVQCLGCAACTIICPANITVNTDANQCGAVVTYPAPTTSGSCGTITSSPASGSFFPKGTTTVTVTSTAGPGCTFTVTVNDNQPPQLTCPGNITVSCAAAVPAPNPGAVAVTDNCPGAVVTHVGDVISNQTCANKFTIARTYKATDAAGNFTTCIQTITVNDVTPPVLTCPAPVTVNCASAVPAPNTALVTGVSDNCSGAVTVVHVSDVISNQTCANKYTITRTYKATDVCGNSALCTQIITVNDVTAPVVTCPSNITVSTPTGSCTAVVNFTPAATDNCSGAVTIVSAPASGTAFPLGTTTVTTTATDACGNSAVCSFTVTVLDGQLPVISSQPANRTVCATSAALFTVTATNAVSYQWEQWNGTGWVPVSGANGATLTFSSVSLGMNGNTYRVKVIGLCTTVASGAATLNVNPLPVVTVTGNALVSIMPGQQTTLNAAATPAGGNYAWRLNGTVINGATAAVLGPLSVDNTGSYVAVYTDLNGCTSTSAVVTLAAAASDNLWVYPNPNNGQFQVRFYNQLNEPATVRVFNAAGQLVKEVAVITGSAYSRTDIDLGSNASGIFIVKVFGEGDRVLAAERIAVFR